MPGYNKENLSMRIETAKFLALRCDDAGYQKNPYECYCGAVENELPVE